MLASWIRGLNPCVCGGFLYPVVEIGHLYIVSSSIFTTGFTNSSKSSILYRMADGKKILIVEDDKFLMLILKSRLAKEGFTVIEAGDGEEGIAKARENNPDLLLLDIIMPKVSGFELLETFRSDPQLSQLPVVVASNLGQESDIEKARSLGVVDYYVKATTPVEDIVRMARKALGLPEFAEEVQIEPSAPVELQTEPPASPVSDQAPQEPIQDSNQSTQ